MILPSKTVLVAGVALASVIGAASAWRWQQAAADQKQAVQQADQHLLEGTSAPETPPPTPSAQQDFSSDMPTFNADQYRQEISDIDRLIFQELPLNEERAESLAQKLEGLAQKIQSESKTRFIAMEAGELQQLAGYARPSAPRQMLQNNWMRIRNNVFDDRAWFARSAADLEPTAETAAFPAPKRPADPFLPSEPSANNGRNVLTGRWSVKALFGNGKPTADPELANSIWMFDRNHLYISEAGGQVSHYTFTEVTDEGGTALHLDPDPANAGPAEEGWMNYEFSGDGLKLAFFDGLGARPEGFAPPEGKSEPLFLVVILQRAQ
jgi:uncharacterized protein (TIGR03067 family)